MAGADEYRATTEEDGDEVEWFTRRLRQGWWTAAPAPSYWITRFAYLRALGFIYFVAFFSLARQLRPLIGEKGLRLFVNDPFPDEPPTYVRARLFRYEFTSSADAQAWWKREPVRGYLHPMSLDDERLQAFLDARGW